MNDETRTTDGFKALVATVVAVLTALTDILGLAPELTDPYYIGLVVSTGTSGIALFYAIRRLLANREASSQGELPL